MRRTRGRRTPAAPGGRTVELAPPRGLSAYRIDIGGSELAILEWPEVRPATAWAPLTPAERKVAGLALSGCSNAEIAARGGCSVHTVANELASAYRKLGIGSRAELAAVASRDGQPR